MKTVCIVNPAAGRQDPREAVLPAFVSYWQAQGEPFEIVATEHPGHAEELVRRVVREGEPARVFAAGGDGTFREAAAGAAGQNVVSLGLIPCGSGDDLVRSLGGRELFLSPECQFRAVPRQLDLIGTEFGPAAGMCAIGLDAAVAYHMVQFKRLPLVSGPMAYKLALVKCFFSRMGVEMRAVIDGEETLSADLSLHWPATVSITAAGSAARRAPCRTTVCWTLCSSALRAGRGCCACSAPTSAGNIWITPHSGLISPSAAAKGWRFPPGRN